MRALRAVAVVACVFGLSVAVAGATPAPAPAVQQALVDLGDVSDSLLQIDGTLLDLTGESTGLPGMQAAIDSVEQSLADSSATSGQLDQLETGVVGAEQYMAAAKAQLDCTADAAACSYVDLGAGTLENVVSGLGTLKAQTAAAADALSGASGLLGSATAGASQLDGTVETADVMVAEATIDLGPGTLTAVQLALSDLTGVSTSLTQIEDGLGSLADPSTGLPAAAGAVDSVDVDLVESSAADGPLDQLAAGATGAEQYMAAAKAVLDCTADATACSSLDLATGVLDVVASGLGTVKSQTVAAADELSSTSDAIGLAEANVGQLQDQMEGFAGDVASVVSELSALGLPGAPTGVTAVAGNREATVSFAAPNADGGAPIDSYTVTASPGGASATGSGSPIVVTGLSNHTTYTFTVTATTALGTGDPSAPSNAVTPLGRPHPWHPPLPPPSNPPPPPHHQHLPHRHG